MGVKRLSDYVDKESLTIFCGANQAVPVDPQPP
jgi:hypothetical protein